MLMVAGELFMDNEKKMTLEYTTTQRGRQKLVYQGYSYNLHSKYDGNEYWLCDKRVKCKCRAKLHTHSGKLTKQIGQHTHLRCSEAMEILMLKDSVRNRPVLAPEPAAQIYSEVSSGINEPCDIKMSNAYTIKQSNVMNQMRLNQECAFPHIETTENPSIPETYEIFSELPSNSNPPATTKVQSNSHFLKKSMWRSQMRLNQECGFPTPKTREDVSIPEKFQVTADGEPFLLYDSGIGDKKRLLVFATYSNLQLLQASSVLFMEGASETSPDLLFNLMTLHGLVRGTVVLLVYALLPDKTRESYHRCFSAVLELCPALSPEKIMMDFQEGCLIALQELFPHCVFKGCFFHLCQCVQKKMAELGLLKRYNTDEEFGIKVRMLPALAFLPVEEVAEAFDDVLEVIPSEILPLCDFFEDNFIGRRTRIGRRVPFFPAALWSLHQSEQEEQRERNSTVLDEWNQRGFQSDLLSRPHPSFWNFLNTIQWEQSQAEEKISQLLLSGNEWDSNPIIVDSYSNKYVSEDGFSRSTASVCFLRKMALMI